MKDSKEIERKFLLHGSRLPNKISNKEICLLHYDTIYQVYKDGLRLRRIENYLTHKVNCFMTVKNDSRGPIERNEWETEIPEWVYLRLKKGNFTYVCKRRYSWDEENFHFDLDRFISPNDIDVIEVEFKTMEDAISFDPDAHFQNLKFTEVTYDLKYTNYELSKWNEELE